MLRYRKETASLAHDAGTNGLCCRTMFRSLVLIRSKREDRHARLALVDEFSERLRPGLVELETED